MYQSHSNSQKQQELIQQRNYNNLLKYLEHRYPQHELNHQSFQELIRLKNELEGPRCASTLKGL